MSDLNSAVADLQSRWPHICDLDRAESVLSIQQGGMTLRELARDLKCFPSLLSHLLRASNFRGGVVLKRFLLAIVFWAESGPQMGTYATNPTREDSINLSIFFHLSREGDSIRT